jgi:dihydrolipoamide dehydrogenase
MADRYDLVVIGAGPGGYIAAIRAAQLGLKVACVDKNRALGGTCLNIGCIPSKALLDSSEWYYLAQHRFSHHGIKVDEVKLDLGKMLARKNQIVKGLTDGVAFLFKKNKVASVHGTARVAGKGRVEVMGDQRSELEAGAILLATGSEPAPLPFLPFDGEQIVSSTEALSFPRVPEQLIVIGAGYIGLELGSAWARLGSQVTVLEFLPRILPMNDAEVVAVLFKSLEKQGLEFHLDTKVTGAQKKRSKVVVQAEQGGKKLEFSGDKVLVAVGRRPCSGNLGLAEIGVRLEEKTGKVVVDEHYQTSVSGVFAIGDLIHGPMLAHKASTWPASRRTSTTWPSPASSTLHRRWRRSASPRRR